MILVPDTLNHYAYLRRFQARRTETTFSNVESDANQSNDRRNEDRTTGISVSLSLSFSWGLATLHNASRNAVKGKDETSVTWNARNTHVSPCRRLSLPLSSTSAPSLPFVSTLPCSNSRIICFLRPTRRTCQQNVAREVLIVSDGD